MPSSDELYRAAMRRYQELCKSSPGIKKATIATHAAVEAFGVPLADLRSRSRRASLVATRVRIMAFAKLVSKGSTYEVARVLNRGHVAAMRAFRQHGDEVAAALGVEHESCE